MKKLFIGKLSPSTTESTLRNLFSSYEPLASVKIITDRFSGESRGFAFIEIEDQKADEAIKTLNGATLDGQVIVVNEARPQAEGSRGNGGRPSYRDAHGSRQNNYRSSSSNRF